MIICEKNDNIERWNLKKLLLILLIIMQPSINYYYCSRINIIMKKKNEGTKRIPKAYYVRNKNVK